MRRAPLFLTLTLLVLSALVAQASDGPQLRFAPGADQSVLLSTQAGCVEVDLEILPGPDPNGLTQTLSSELTNCGDEAALLDVDVTLDLNGTVLGPFSHHVYLAAGGSLVRNITFYVPPVVPAGSYSLCVKATIGESSDEDCVTVDVEEAAVKVNAGEVPQLRFAEGEDQLMQLASSAGCVEVDLELIPGPDPQLKTYTLSSELTNCGDAASLIDVEINLDLNGIVLGPFTHHVYLAAGGSLVRGVTFAVPPPVPEGSYTLCVTATIGEASSEDCATLEVAGAAAVSSLEPTVLSSPNPFNAQTRISYVVAVGAHVKLDIFNMLGRRVTTLFNAYADPGNYSVVWDGRDESGASVASGTYLYRLEVGDQKWVRQMTLLK